MDLSHEFSVPAGLAATWAAFTDIRSTAECFPGATVTAVEGDSFEGSCKVKLGPIALVYNGAGTFSEKDDAAGRLGITAKGKDKRGNGTASAEVSVTMTEVSPAETRVSVLTHLQITGKPAQFGRGVMQDVSDKLLDQFVACLEHKVGAPDVAPVEGAGEPDAEAPAADADAGPASVPTGAAAVSAPVSDQDAGPASAPPTAARPTAPPPPRSDSIDLGTTVVRVLLRSYGKQVAAALCVLAVLWWWRRR